ncbi:MAG TPA: hypothetical protein ENK48_03825 [Gammaproteobacteria bacterium]|nr:hypothetical protein [Gammaproteobacteria bacterium]
MSERKTTKAGKENKEKQSKSTSDQPQSPRSGKTASGSRSTTAGADTGKKEHKAKTEAQAAAGTAPQAGPAPASGGGKGGSFIAILALMVAAGGVAAGYKLWQENQTVDRRLEERSGQIANRLQDVQRRLNALDGRVGELASTSQDIQPRLDALRKEVEGRLAALGQDTRKQMEQQFSILQDSVNQLQARLEEKKPEAAQKPLWEPAEAEYLIRIADDSLRLRRDVVTALAALRAADQRLQAVGHPAFATTRRLLAEEINALLAVPRTDVAATAATLAGLQDRVAELPLKGGSSGASPAESAGQEEEGAAEAASGESGGWRGFFSDLWQALKSLVTVRRRDVTDEPLMTPAQTLYLSQNIQLKLETARLALLRGDEAAYHGALKAARQWISRYYEEEDAAVKEVLATLDKLDGITLNPELPSVKASLEAIQEVLASRAYLSAIVRPPRLALDNPGQARPPAAAMTANGGEQS